MVGLHGAVSAHQLYRQNSSRSVVLLVVTETIFLLNSPKSLCWPSFFPEWRPYGPTPALTVSYTDGVEPVSSGVPSPMQLLRLSASGSSCPPGQPSSSSFPFPSSSEVCRRSCRPPRGLEPLAVCLPVSSSLDSDDASVVSEASSVSRGSSFDAPRWFAALVRRASPVVLQPSTPPAGRCLRSGPGPTAELLCLSRVGVLS